MFRRSMPDAAAGRRACSIDGVFRRRRPRTEGRVTARQVAGAGGIWNTVAGEGTSVRRDEGCGGWRAARSALPVVSPPAGPAGRRPGIGWKCFAPRALKWPSTSGSRARGRRQADVQFKSQGSAEASWAGRRSSGWRRRRSRGKRTARRRTPPPLPRPGKIWAGDIPSSAWSKRDHRASGTTGLLPPIESAIRRTPVNRWTAWAKSRIATKPGRPAGQTLRNDRGSFLVRVNGASTVLDSPQGVLQRLRQEGRGAASIERPGRSRVEGGADETRTSG